MTAASVTSGGGIEDGAVFTVAQKFAQKILRRAKKKLWVKVGLDSTIPI